MKKVGRKSIYNPKYCNEIINWMSKGYSVASFAGKIGVVEKTIYNWAMRNDKFLQSLKIGKYKSILFWEKIGIDGTMGKIPHFNATTWIYNMKNRCGWSDEFSIDSEFEKIEERKKESKFIAEEFERVKKQLGFRYEFLEQRSKEEKEEKLIKAFTQAGLIRQKVLLERK